jgi:hypothetical protein
MTEGKEESQQLDPIQIQETITEGTPVALRTRRSRQQKAHNRINDDEGDSFRFTTQNRDTDNELIRQLKTKIKEQENSINELSSAVERFLKIQPIVKKLQGNILKISKQAVAREKIKVTASNIDPEIVKPFPIIGKVCGHDKATNRQCEIWYTRQEFTMSQYNKTSQDI